MNMMYYPEGTDDALKSLVRISQEYGKNPEYVLAGGGNTSCKIEREMFVKASGQTLATIEKEGFVSISLDALDKIWASSYSKDKDKREAEVLVDLLASSTSETKLRPSVETLLHGLFPYTFVVHTHPTLINGLSCSVQGKEAAQSLFGDKMVWIPVVDPGYILALEVKKATDTYREKFGLFPKIIFLQNHGVFVSANKLWEIRELYAELTAKISEAIKNAPQSETRDLEKSEFKEVLTQIDSAIPGSHREVFSNDDIAPCIQSLKAFKELELAPTPDHIVYAGYRPLFIADQSKVEAEISGYIKDEGIPPRIIVIQGKGVIACSSSDKKARIARKLFEDNVKIAVYSRSFGGIQFMPEENISFIRNWEVERYREKVSS